MIRKHIIKLTTLLLLTIGGCSGDYHVSTNLDKDNFSEYFSAAEVSI